MSMQLKFCAFLRLRISLFAFQGGSLPFWNAFAVIRA